MPVQEKDEMKVWQRRDRRTQLTVWAGYFFGMMVFVWCWQLMSEETFWDFVWDAPRQAGDMASRMVPPKWGYINALWRAIWDTINIATLGTLMALVLAGPTAFCAARNTTPSVNFVRPVALFIIVSSRSINSLIWALILVAIVGPGVFAGIIAIGLRSIGFCAKLLYEAPRAPEVHKFLLMELFLRYCQHLQASPFFAGTSIFASRRSSVLSGPVELVCI